jgi:hypothetical protein
MSKESGENKILFSDDGNVDESKEGRGRLTAAKAGYMELQGACKDSDCKKVYVKGGVAAHKGCCNEFQPEHNTTCEFRCGTCEYLIDIKPKKSQNKD